MKRRASLQIIHKILSTVESYPDSCCPVTHLLYATHLNTGALRPYLDILAANNLIKITGPTQEQFKKRPSVKKWVRSLRKSEIFLKLYSQSYEQDLIWWEAAGEEADPRKKVQMSKHSVKSKIQSSWILGQCKNYEISLQNKRPRTWLILIWSSSSSDITEPTRSTTTQLIGFYTITMTECCCSCGELLWIERFIIHKLGCSRDIRLDICFECQTKGFHAVLDQCISKVPDPIVRQELRLRWDKVGTNVTIKDLANALDKVHST